MEYEKNYKLWLKQVKDPALLQELKELEGNQEELEKRFGSYLKFSTSGIRGLIGVGTHYINRYMIAKITQGVATHLFEKTKTPSVVISYDNRNHSSEWAKLVASILANQGIKCYIFKVLTPTPIVSYAVRKLQTTVGINITSSHNASVYNGYKVVDHIGSQVGDKDANSILQAINKVNEFKVKEGDFEALVEKESIVWLDDQMVNEYVLEAKKFLPKNKCHKNNFKIVYTSLHGTGFKPVTKLLKLAGFKAIFYPENQIIVDPNFTTAPEPNPERADAYVESLKVAQKQKADIILATDPDCDRVGVMVKHKGKFVQLTGDQVGVVLLNYLLQNKKLYKNSFLVTTVVSSDLSILLAKHYGIEVAQTLTGFKYIAPKVEELVQERGEKRFVFAYEESCGYMATTNIRDKDGIVPTALLAQVAAEQKDKGRTLVDYLADIYKALGYVLNDNYSFEFEGLEGIATIQKAVNNLRNHTPKYVGTQSIIKVVDYLNTKETNLPAQNFLEFHLSGGAKIIVRPSGTEPKLKIYTTVVASSEKQGKNQLISLKRDLKKILF